jgi:hypothetical protein
MPVEIAIVLETPEPIEARMNEISELSGVAIL